MLYDPNDIYPFHLPLFVERQSTKVDLSGMEATLLVICTIGGLNIFDSYHHLFQLMGKFFGKNESESFYTNGIDNGHVYENIHNHLSNFVNLVIRSKLHNRKIEIDQNMIHEFNNLYDVNVNKKNYETFVNNILTKNQMHMYSMEFDYNEYFLFDESTTLNNSFIDLFNVFNMNGKFVSVKFALPLFKYMMKSRGVFISDLITIILNEAKINNKISTDYIAVNTEINTLIRLQELYKNNTYLNNYTSYCFVINIGYHYITYIDVSKMFNSENNSPNKTLCMVYEPLTYKHDHFNFDYLEDIFDKGYVIEYIIFYRNDLNKNSQGYKLILQEFIYYIKRDFI